MCNQVLGIYSLKFVRGESRDPHYNTPVGNFVEKYEGVGRGKPSGQMGRWRGFE